MNSFLSGHVKDTVTTDEEDDEVNTHNHPWKDRATICHDAVIHYHVPVLTCKNLHANIVHVKNYFVTSQLCPLEKYLCKSIYVSDVNFTSVSRVLI